MSMTRYNIISTPLSCSAPLHHQSRHKEVSMTRAGDVHYDDPDVAPTRKNTIDESVPVEDEGHFSLSRKTSRAPSIASVEEARPTTPVSEEKEKL
jgi:hypothetical protein